MLIKQVWAPIPGFHMYLCNRDRSRVGVEVKQRHGRVQQKINGEYRLQPHPETKPDRLLPDDIYSATFYGAELIPQA